MPDLMMMGLDTGETVAAIATGVVTILGAGYGAFAVMEAREQRVEARAKESLHAEMRRIEAQLETVRREVAAEREDREQAMADQELGSARIAEVNKGRLDRVESKVESHAGDARAQGERLAGIESALAHISRNIDILLDGGPRRDRRETPPVL